jgi:formate hydrogenlyase transcriptional activator
VGTSEVMRHVRELISKVAPTASAVLIEGESGTGKDLVAGVVHRLSPRAGRPFIAINFAALPAELAQAELLGYEKGAFTGATARKHGAIADADSGTVYLKAIDAVSPALQSKLLRFLQDMEFQWLGADRPTRVDVRVIAATNRDLGSLVQSGEFREDLYYRLNVVRIPVPPLRSRTEDIPALLQQFVARWRNSPKRVSVSPEVLDAFRAHSWPGNVRELQNVVERAVIMSRTGELALADLQWWPPVTGARQASWDVLEAERRNLEAAIREAKGKLRGPQGAADRLGMDPDVLLRRLNKLGISVPRATEKS